MTVGSRTVSGGPMDARARRSLRGGLRWTVAAVLFGLLVAHIVRHGPLTLVPPKTPLSHTEPAQQASEPYLLFLREVGSRVPAGSTIVVVEETGEIGYLLAVGQLPDQIVRHRSALSGDSSRALPDWVACFDGAFDDPRFELDARLPNGVLYRRHR